ncbi:MAG: hypothetical protein GTO41_23075, partial [Burkholderiales bacterium]|nr:hypothetical protein [Burkholderiales bacterium]
AFLVNGVWSLLLEDRSVLTYGFYYAYNGMVAFTTAVLCGWLGRRIVNWTLVSVICGLSLQISVSGIFEIVGARRTLLFNNPVQLAVYAVLLSSIFWVLFPKIHLSRWLSMLTPAAVYGTGAYLAAIAVSRAGVLAMILLILLQSLARAKYMISALVLAGAVLWFGVGDEVSKSVNNRFIDKSQSFTEELQHRGYDRIWHYPEHLLVGAGEGAFERFSDRELHSTYGTVLFSYGIVGSILFARIFWQMFCQYGIASLLYLIPAFAFGSTENGLRHSEFWILIVLICFISYQARSANAGQFLHGRLSSCAVSQRRVRPSRQ